MEFDKDFGRNVKTDANIEALHSVDRDKSSFREMIFIPRSHSLVLSALLLLLLANGWLAVLAQAQEIGEGENDPIKLFERGQDAHAKADYKTAIQLYEAAIKLKPEFPEAEFQKSMALLAINRKAEALEGFHRTVALRPDWAMAYTKFGALLAFPGNSDKEAEPILRRALELDQQNLEALVPLAVIRQRAGDLNEAVKLITAATSLKNATHDTWRRRAFIEHAAGDTKAAIASISKAFALDSRMTSDRLDRARFLLEMNDRAGALADLDALKPTLAATTDVSIVLQVAQLYARAGRPDESLRLLDGLSGADRSRPEVVALRAEIAADPDSSAEERAALEKLLQRDPRNPSLLAKLGSAYRRVDPAKSESYYLRALQIEPDNPRYATGYAAALVQSRHFAEAVVILQKVINKSPDDYVAHANLALALYELKRFAEALPEYEWISIKHPEIAATYFFIATAHDNLGRYEDALTAYQDFLSRADPVNDKLEIEKVNLRLPSLRDQIKRGQGVKRKRS